MPLSKRRVIGTAVAVVVAIAVVLFGAGWFYSDEIKSGALVPDHQESEFDLVVAAVGDGEITLRATSETDRDGAWSKDGVWGLKLEGGYARVGKVLEKREDEVVRELVLLSDGPEVGEQARLDSFSFPGDPLTAHGILFEDVVFTSGLGDFPAWFVDGPQDTWVVLVHGHNSNRREGLRMLQVLAERGYPTLLITYRNDEGAPANPDGYIRFGATEWEDLEGAVRYAIENGAQSVVPVGYSMGGGIVARFLYRSSLVSQVPGAILDAPMLDFGATVDYRASRRRLPVVGLPIPGILTDVAKVISAGRFGIDWGALDYVQDAQELSVPILLFHGDADPSVPIATSDQLAEARPDIVDYVRIPDTLHVAAWNADPEVYGIEVSGFLRELSE